MNAYKMISPPLLTQFPLAEFRVPVSKILNRVENQFLGPVLADHFAAQILSSVIPVIVPSSAQVPPRPQLKHVLGWELPLSVRKPVNKITFQSDISLFSTSHIYNEAPFGL